VRFDDRLTTVLAQSAGDPHDRSVRWRQLVDLVARATEPRSPLVETALAAIAADIPHIDEAVRAGAARSIASLRPPLALVTVFAGESVQIAAPLLAAADFDEAALRELFEAASDDNRRFLAALHPQLVRQPVRHEDDQAVPSISDVVARIERIRHARDDAPPEVHPIPALERASQPSLFRWECTPSGEIAWVDGAPRGALIGRSLAPSAADEGIDPAIPQAFARHAAFHDATLNLAGEGEIAGEWKISGAPAFEPADGRFAGYRGVAVRGEARRASSNVSAEAPDHDSIRELVHELKTPLNAIIGFAEMIDGQYLGPANDRYRARAAEIVGQARLLVAAIDDLDLAARIQSGREPATEPVEVGQLFRHLAPELKQRATDRGAILDIDDSDTGASCAIHPGIAEQLVRRFCEAAIDLSAEGERMVMKLQLLRDRCSVFVAIPRALRGQDAEELLAGAPARQSDEEPDPFFWLRLVRGLARLTGGELMTADGNLSLILPKAGA
jgi:signal transduction histidine kinase